MWIDPRNKFANLSTIPQDILDNLESWQNLEFGYRQKIWLLNEVLEICKAQNEDAVAEALHSCRFPSMQADISRLLLLRVFGGFWVDLKLRLNRRFLDRLVNHVLVLTEHFEKDDLPVPNGRLSNSFIGARLNNQIIATALTSAVSNVNRRMPGSIYHVTGATNLELALRNEQGPEVHFMIPHQTAWDYLFSIIAGSYNGHDMHWSQREQRESPYLN
jgi:mannosyltransferase OCH1-like enzyme